MGILKGEAKTSAVDELLNHFAALSVELKEYGSLSKATKAATERRDQAVEQLRDAEAALVKAIAQARELRETSNAELIAARGRAVEIIKEAEVREGEITKRAMAKAADIAAQAARAVEAKQRELEQEEKALHVMRREAETAGRTLAETREALDALRAKVAA